MTHCNIVLPPVLPLTVDDAREKLAPVLRRVCSNHGPKKVAKYIGGCDEKTVRDARDEKSTLRLDYAANLLLLDGTALDGLLNHFGRGSHPIGTGGDEHDRARESKVLKAALALSIALSDDDQIDADEVRANRETIENAIDALKGLLAKDMRPSLKAVSR